MILKNRDVTPGSFVCSRNGNLFLVLDVVPLGSNYVGMRYICTKGGGEFYVEYSEEDLSGVFLTDCIYVRTGGGGVTAV